VVVDGKRQDVFIPDRYTNSILIYHVPEIFKLNGLRVGPDAGNIHADASESPLDRDVERFTIGSPNAKIGGPMPAPSSNVRIVAKMFASGEIMRTPWLDAVAQ